MVPLGYGAMKLNLNQNIKKTILNRYCYGFVEFWYLPTLFIVDADYNN